MQLLKRWKLLWKNQWFPTEVRDDLDKQKEWGLNDVLQEHNIPFEPLVTECKMSFSLKDCRVACGFPVLLEFW